MHLKGRSKSWLFFTIWIIVFWKSPKDKKDWDWSVDAETRLKSRESGRSGRSGEPQAYVLTQSDLVCCVADCCCVWLRNSNFFIFIPVVQAASLKPGGGAGLHKTLTIISPRCWWGSSTFMISMSLNLIKTVTVLLGSWLSFLSYFPEEKNKLLLNGCKGELTDFFSFLQLPFWNRGCYLFFFHNK